MWGLHRSDPLASILMPSPLTVVCTDPLEYRVFAGGTDGVLYAADMHVAAMRQTGPAASAPSQSIQVLLQRHACVGILCPFLQ